MADEIIKVNINEKALVPSLSESASIFASDDGKLVRVPAKEVGKGISFGNEYKGNYPDDILYGESDTVTFYTEERACNVGDYIIAKPDVMTQFGNRISLWMCTKREDIYGNGNAYNLTFERKFSYGEELPAVGENIQKRVLVTEGGNQPRWEDFQSGGNMNYCGENSTLPEEANEGDVYKVTSESVETGKLLITVSGVNSIVRNPVYPGADFTGSSQYDIDRSAAISKFLSYAFDGMYGEYGNSFNSYIESGGNKYTIPWITTSSFGDDFDDFLINSDDAFDALFVNGKSLVCYSNDMSYLPESLKQYAIKYPAGTCFVYREGEWSALDADVITDLAVRVKELEGKSGTSGAMVFKGVVDELPEDANEGEVYAKKSWDEVGLYINTSNLVFRPHGFGVSGTTEAEAWTDITNDIYGLCDGVTSFKFVVRGHSYIYKICQVAGANETYFDAAAGESNVTSDIHLSDKAIVHIYKSSSDSTNGVKELYIRHNGEWIEL